MLCRDPDTGVMDCNSNILCRGSLIHQLNFYRSFRLCILDGITNEINKYLLQALFIAKDIDFMMRQDIPSEIEFDLLVRSNILHLCDDITNKWPDIEESEAHSHFTRFDAANINKIVQKGIETF